MDFMLSIVSNKRIRQLLQRFGRKIYCVARGDFHNTPTSNGEYWLLDHSIKNCTPGSFFLDVGANLGDWSDRALSVAKSENIAIKVMAFEPSAATREILVSRLKNNPALIVNPSALSSEAGKFTFYSKGVGSGTNSLSNVSGSVEEVVEVTTLDLFMAENKLHEIAMLKVDVEGFDFKVLLGAEKALLNGSVGLVQFEYNWRWLINHHCLRDVFYFIENKPYKFGKLVGNKVIVFNHWHFELDRFFENNYLLIHKDNDLLKSSEFSDVNESNVY